MAISSAAGFIAGLLLGLAGCRVELGAPQGERAHEPAHAEVWVYTSIYRDVVSALEPIYARELPGIRVRFFQAGSEKVRARLEAELAAGSTRCDLLSISDPGAYRALAARGKLALRVPPAALRSPRAMLDLGGRFALSRVSMMVIGWNPNALPGVARPTSFADLARQELAGHVTMGDPLSSGTAFSTVALLSERLGWSYFEGLAAGGLTASGGNAAVLARLAAREAAAGILLYENVLTARRKGGPVEAILPAEGAVLIPGHVAILAGGRAPDAAARVQDVLLGPQAQRVMIESGLHAADVDAPPPEGAPPLAALLRSGIYWREGQSPPDDDAVRERWARVMR